MSKSATNVQGLFKAARQEGTLSAASLQALTVVDVGQQIQNALGVSLADALVSEGVLVAMLIDDSGSIRSAQEVDASGLTKYVSHEQSVRDGHNLVLESLKGSKARNSILIHCRYLNGRVLYEFVPRDQAVMMDANNYQATGGTPLYDESVVLLGTVLAKTKESADSGIPVRTITLIVTDGHDQHSWRFKAADVANIVRDMLNQENHIVAGMGIDDGGTTDFRRVFGEMGIRDEWILTPANTPKEIRKAFNAFSSTAVAASQTAQSFSKTAIGGFGN